jgi:signal peptidase II
MQAARGASLSDGDPPAQPEGRRRVGVLLAVALTVLATDVVSKLFVVDRLAERRPIEVVDGLLTLRLVRNSGAAFGVAQGLTIVFSCVAVVVVLVILRIARRLRSTAWALALGLVLGGAVGNLIDRIFREPAPFRGRVIDFLELPNWPVFNLADACIVTGGVLMVLLSLRGAQYDGTRAAG